MSNESTPQNYLNLAKSKILLTGGSGFLGQQVFKKLIAHGAKSKNIFVPRSKDYDLRQRSVCRQLTENVDLVIHLAGNVGGIGKNQAFPGTLFYDNLIMGVELIEASRLNQIKKFVCIGTICSYPKFSPIPFKETNLWNGYPEETNAPYGLAKKMLLVQLQAYREQYGFNGIYLLPVNLYGPGDNFDENSSHVIPALIKKVLNAKSHNLTSVEVWGDGTPTREFLFVDDAAEAIILATKNYNGESPVNIGSSQEISIKKLIKLICELTKYKGKIIWDTSKPNGQPRRKLDVSRAKKYFGFSAETPFKTGLQKTIDWYVQNHS